MSGKKVHYRQRSGFVPSQCKHTHTHTHIVWPLSHIVKGNKVLLCTLIPHSYTYTQRRPTSTVGNIIIIIKVKETPDIDPMSSFYRGFVKRESVGGCWIWRLGCHLTTSALSRSIESRSTIISDVLKSSGGAHEGLMGYGLGKENIFAACSTCLKKVCTSRVVKLVLLCVHYMKIRIGCRVACY